MTWKKSDIFAIMVGHGRSLDGTWDPGCTYGKYTEAGLMLEIVQVAVKWLRKSGVEVLTDADDANNRNMKSSVAWANNRKAKYYMSVHCDYSGATAGVYPQYVSSAGKKMGNKIGKYVANKLGMKFKGVCKRTDLYELNATNMPSIVFECGSIKADLKFLKDADAYGKALAQAICKFIGVTFYVSPQTKLLKKAAYIFAQMTKLRFKYSNSGNATSWKAAKKKKTSNCATYISYVLQELGYLKPGQVFWCNDGKVKFKGSGAKKQLLKNFKITHPKKSPKSCKVKKADICGYTPAHTQMFAKWKNGNALWYSFGASDVGKKLPRKRGKYNTKKIDTIIRLK